MSAGCCSSVDVVSSSKKTKQSFSDVQVKLTAERAESHLACLPRLTYTLWLPVIMSLKNTLRAVSQLSAEKYCSVALMLDKSVEITHSHEVVLEQVK